ncbi:MAG TPA: helix-turn-helix transcriptional regulator [Chloroflexota bacterium]|nr:helix-turn-helix transcriptional regulator [Chloroflexota bacterium]
MNAGLLRLRRQQASLSQRDLALRANVGLATIVRLEQGAEGQPRTIRALARALKVRATDLQAAEVPAVTEDLNEGPWATDPEWVWDAPL